MAANLGVRGLRIGLQGMSWPEIVSELHNVTNATALICATLHDPNITSAPDDPESDANTR